MKIKCKLVKTQEIRTLEDFKVAFVFRPTLEEWKNKIKLVITTPDPAVDTEKLGTPVGIDDIIILEMITKETQTKLDETADKSRD